MPRTAFFKGCLTGIRESIYGRDGRKPIADSIYMSSVQYMQEALEEQRKDNCRIAEIDITPTSDEDYFRLTFTRTNRK